MMRNAIPQILKEKFVDGVSFDDLWQELYKDKDLAKVMINKKGEKRLGLLQGLTNRIKANKEEGIAIIQKEDGKNYYIFVDNSVDKQIKLTSNYLSLMKNINLDKEVQLDKVTDSLLKEHSKLVKQLESVNNKLKKEA